MLQAAAGRSTRASARAERGGCGGILLEEALVRAVEDVLQAFDNLLSKNLSTWTNHELCKFL